MSVFTLVAILLLFELHLSSILPSWHGFQEEYIDFGLNITLASKQTIQAGLEAAVNRSRRGLVRSAIFSRSSKDAFRQLLLILFSFGGNIVSNSGLQYKHPRGVCTTPVKSNQNGIQCDMCDFWFHAKCDVKCHAINLVMFIHMFIDMFKLRVPQLL